MIFVFRGANSNQSDSNNLDLKNFPGGACPQTPLGECACSVPSTTGFVRNPCFVLTLACVQTLLTSFQRGSSGIPAPAPFRFDLRISKTAQCVLRLLSSIIKTLKMKQTHVHNFSFSTFCVIRVEIRGS